MRSTRVDSGFRSVSCPVARCGVGLLERWRSIVAISRAIGIPSRLEGLCNASILKLALVRRGTHKTDKEELSQELTLSEILLSTGVNTRIRRR